MQHTQRAFTTDSSLTRQGSRRMHLDHEALPEHGEGTLQARKLRAVPRVEELLYLALAASEPRSQARTCYARPAERNDQRCLEGHSRRQRDDYFSGQRG